MKLTEFSKGVVASTDPKCAKLIRANVWLLNSAVRIELLFIYVEELNNFNTLIGVYGNWHLMF